MPRKIAFFLLVFLSINVFANSKTVHDSVLLKITGSLGSSYSSWKAIAFYSKRADIYSQCYGSDSNCPIYINLARNSTAYIDVQDSEFGSTSLYCKFSITSQGDSFSTALIYSGGGGACTLSGDPNTNLNLKVNAY